MERKEAYAKIKELNLQEECKKKYGKNFTQCSNSDLELIIEKATNSTKQKVKKPTISTHVDTPATMGDLKDIFKAFGKLVETLRSKHILLDSEAKRILG